MFNKKIHANNINPEELKATVFTLAPWETQSNQDDLPVGCSNTLWAYEKYEVIVNCTTITSVTGIFVNDTDLNFASVNWPLGNH